MVVMNFWLLMGCGDVMFIGLVNDGVCFRKLMMWVMFLMCI